MTAVECNAAPASKSQTTRRKSRRFLTILVLVILAIVAILCVIGVFGGNVRVIEAGRAYRSATLTGLNYTGITARLVGNDLSSVLRRDHIRTVINLRGGPS